MKTTFRQTPLRDMVLVADAEERDAWQHQNPSVDGKIELTGVFVDYYDSDLLEWKRFMYEFEPDGIVALGAYVRFLEEHLDVDWSVLEPRAREVLRLLRKIP